MTSGEDIDQRDFQSSRIHLTLLRGSLDWSTFSGRSRLVRLIPEAPHSSPLTAIRRLLEHRLSGLDGNEAKEEWIRVVEGKHALWVVSHTPSPRTDVKQSNPVDDLSAAPGHS